MKSPIQLSFVVGIGHQISFIYGKCSKILNTLCPQIECWLSGLKFTKCMS